MQDCPSRVGRLSSPVSYARDEDKATLSRQVFRHGMLEPIEVANHVLNQLVHRFRTDIVRKKDHLETGSQCRIRTDLHA